MPKEPPRQPRKAKVLPTPPASKVGDVTYATAIAIRALRDGKADPGQQQIARNWIISEACGKRYFPYHQTDRDTTFALGRYFVAEQIVGLFYIDMSTLRGDLDVSGNN